MGDGEPGGQVPAVPGRAEELRRLRSRMAAIPGRVGGKSAAAEAGVGSVAGEVIDVGPGLGAVLPRGGLVRGSVVACTGSGALLAGLLAAVTAAGEWAAVVGAARLGLLAVAEMGGCLPRLAHIAEPGPDLVAVAMALLDGLGVVVLDTAADAVAPARARIVATRAHRHDTVVLVTAPDWPHPDLRLRSRITGYAGLGAGRGRIRELRLEVETCARQGPLRRTELTLSGTAAGRTVWTVPERVPAAGEGGRPVASGQ
ncbi:hypothetical protein [Nocardia carnea]|uniref:hypothetical protein n=1 Tax=Nocardia carnea TaxID=37328 RepID=UPI0024545837|nr:hypothetical protein [Nocardia carnea]